MRSRRPADREGGIVAQIPNFDIFPKEPEEIRVKSSYGGLGMSYFVAANATPRTTPLMPAHSLRDSALTIIHTHTCAVSLVVITCMFYLGYQETVNYLSSNIKHTLHVDVQRSGTIPVYFNITFHRLSCRGKCPTMFVYACVYVWRACAGVCVRVYAWCVWWCELHFRAIFAVVFVDAVDDSGDQQANVQSTITKTRLSLEGVPLTGASVTRTVIIFVACICMLFMFLWQRSK